MGIKPPPQDKEKVNDTAVVNEQLVKLVTELLCKSIDPWLSEADAIGFLERLKETGYEIRKQFKYRTI